MTTDLATFAETEYTMRYRQPYTTEGLNQKLAVVVPPGIYRGFGLGADTGDRTVELTADSDAGDMVAIYQTATGYSLTIRYTSGAFLLDLSAYESETVVVTIHATYAVGATTSARVRAYTQAEYDGASEKDELVVLGSVAVPAAGNPVTAAMISYDLRSYAWLNQPPGTLLWAPVHKNAGFEIADTVGGPYAYTAYPWIVEGGGSNTMEPSETDPHSGTKCMEVTYVSGAATWLLAQPIGVPVTAGQRLRVRLYKKMVQAATGGTAFVEIYYRDTDGAIVQDPATPIYLTTTADADYEEFDHIYEVPSGLDIVELGQVRFGTSLIDFATPGPAIRLDDFQVWLEVDASDPYPFRDAVGARMASSLLLADYKYGDEFSDLGKQALLEPTSQNNLKLSRLDGQDSASHSPVGLEMLGQLLGLGDALRNSETQARTPRITSKMADTGTYDYTLMWEMTDPDGGGVPVRIYTTAASQNGWALTINARWTGSAWTKDGLLADSRILQLTRDGGLVCQLRESHSDWTAWDETVAAFDVASGGNIIGLAPTKIQRGPVELGALQLSTDANARVARLSVEMADYLTTGVEPQRTLVAELVAPSGRYSTRIYTRTEGAVSTMEVLVNAEWGGTSWTRDDSYTPSTKYIFGGYGLYMNSQAALATWDDTNTATGWNRENDLLSPYYSSWLLQDGNLIFGNATVGESNPVPAAVPTRNALYAKNIVKAWGCIDCDGSGNITDIEGFNTHGESITGAGDLEIDIWVMDDDEYSVVATALLTPNSIYAPIILNKTSTGFDIRLMMSGAVYRNLLTGGVPATIHFIVIGKQS